MQPLEQVCWWERRWAWALASVWELPVECGPAVGVGVGVGVGAGVLVGTMMALGSGPGVGLLVAARAVDAGCVVGVG